MLRPVLKKGMIMINYKFSGSESVNQAWVDIVTLDGYVTQRL